MERYAIRTKKDMEFIDTQKKNYNGSVTIKR